MGGVGLVLLPSLPDRIPRKNMGWVVAAAIALVTAFTLADSPSRRTKVLVLALLAISFALPHLVAWQHAPAVSTVLLVLLTVSLIVYFRFHRYLTLQRYILNGHRRTFRRSIPALRSWRRLRLSW